MINTPLVFVFLCVAIRLCLANLVEIQVEPINEHHDGDGDYKPLIMKVKVEGKNLNVWDNWKNISKRGTTAKYLTETNDLKKQLIVQDILQGEIDSFGTAKQ